MHPAQKLQYQEVVDKFKAAKILVFGDIMLDLYIQGDVERISPEAPVPIVFERSREYSLGGAGNVAANIAALGGKVTLFGIVGNDSEGKMVEKICRRMGVTPRFMRVPKRSTILKTRVVSGPHQLSRIDREHIGAITKDIEKRVERFVKNIGDQDTIIISDYAKGLVTETAIRALKKRFGGKKIIANIKPVAYTGIFKGGTDILFKGVDIRLYRGINTITMNANEGKFFSGVDAASDKGAADASRLLSNRLNVSVVLTRGAHGLTAHDRGLRKSIHVTNRPLHVFDVTGAGDTVVATFALMLGAGVPLFKAAEVANHAGGIVVGRRGTAVVQLSDLKPFLA
ncbi:MAG: PfkB family carbohydrate kinase [Patescibacteria group bacterium]